MSDSEINSYNNLEADLASTLIPKVIGKYNLQDQRNFLNLRWNNKVAINKAYQMLTLIKTEPNNFNIKSGGEAVWKKVKSSVRNHIGKWGYYKEIKIEDAAEITFLPTLSINFFHTYVHMRLYPDKAKLLGEVFSSVAYHGSNGVVEVISDSFESSIATLVAIKLLNHNIMAPIQIVEFHTFLHTIITNEASNEKLVNTPIKDALESYLFSTDNRSLLPTILGAGLGGLAGYKLFGDSLLGGVLGGVGGAAFARGVIRNPNNPKSMKSKNNPTNTSTQSSEEEEFNF